MNNHNLIKEILAILGDAMPRVSIYFSAMEDGAEKEAVAEILSCVERNVPTLTGRPFWVDGPAACADTTTRLEAENAQLRTRCQASESALRQLIRTLDYVLGPPHTHGDLAYAKSVLAKARLALEHGATGGKP